MATVLNSSIAVSRVTVAPRAVRARTVAAHPAARSAASSSSFVASPSVASSLSRRNRLATTGLKASVARNVGSTRRGGLVVRAAGDEGEAPGFLYTRAGVIAIGVGLTGAGYALYYGLQANGVDPIWAGNIVQLTFVLGLSLAWAGSYVGRVMNKDMTYVKQLKDYEDAVMAKRLEELPEAELEKMMEEIKRVDEDIERIK